MTTFSDLPDLGNGLRMVGSMLMDEEQFTVEQWHQDRGEWTCRLSGLAKYAELRRQRREDRKRSWAERNQADDESDEYYRNLGGRKP
jgi:hypothetical protein